MAEYALIVMGTNTIREFRELPTVPPDVTHKGLKWLPVIVTDPPVGLLQIREGPVITLEAERVTRVWTVRNKTPAEIDLEKESHLDNLERLGFEIDFDHENRIRVLEGKSQITASTFRAALKARL